MAVGNQTYNLLRNGDFESWSNGDTSPPDYWYNTSQTEIFKDMSSIKFGSYSARLRNPAATAGELIHTAMSPSPVNRTATFGCWVKSDTADRIRLYIYTNGDYNYSPYYGVADVNNWKFLTVTCAISGSTFVACKIEGGAQIYAYFDGAILVEGDEPFEFAPNPLDECAPRAHGPAHLNETLTKIWTDDADFDITGASGKLEKDNNVSLWKFKKIPITGASGCGTNYQVKLTVHSGSGADSDGVVYLDGQCKDFPNDIRFYNEDGSVEYSYFVEDLTADPIVVWIKIAENLDTDKTFRIMYGNSEWDTASNGDATFIFFDKFDEDLIDTDKWEVTQEGGSVVITSTDNPKHGVRSLKHHKTVAADRAYFKSTPFGDFGLTGKFSHIYYYRRNAYTGGSGAAIFHYNQTDPSLQAIFHSSYGNYFTWYDTGYRQYKAIAMNTWYKVELRIDVPNSSFKILIDDVEEVANGVFRNAVSSIDYVVASDHNQCTHTDYLDTQFIRKYVISEPVVGTASVAYASDNPEAVCVEKDAGMSSIWDMSSFDVAETGDGETKYKVSAYDTPGNPNFDNDCPNWLDKAGIRAKSDLTGRYFQVKVQFISDGTQDATIDDVSIIYGAETSDGIPEATATVRGLLPKFSANNFENDPTEGFRIKAGGVSSAELNIPSKVWAYRATSPQYFPADQWIKVALNAELYDGQNEFDSSTVSGTATSTVANKLVDTNANFTAADNGKTVWNTTDNTYATVTAVDSSTQLSLDADIMANGEGYNLYFSRFTATEAGYYLVYGQVYFHTSGSGDQYAYVAIHKNGGGLTHTIFQVTRPLVYTLTTTCVANLAADDKISLYVYSHDANANIGYDGGARSYLNIHRLS